MNGGDIRFVHLGITINHLKSSISVFGFRIAFYGIIIGIGMLAGLWIAQSDAKRRGQDPELYLDFALYAIICSIIGARLYYVIFEWDYYKNNLLQIFNLRAGGLAIYGGVIAGTITMIVYTRMKKVSFFSMADRLPVRSSAGGETSLTARHLAAIQTVCWPCGSDGLW